MAKTLNVFTAGVPAAVKEQLIQSVEQALQTVPEDAAWFDRLPDSAFVRESQLVQSPKRPHFLAPLPFSAPTLWRKVKNRTFPAPVKLSLRITAWRVGEVRSWFNKLRSHDEL